MSITKKRTPADTEVQKNITTLESLCQRLEKLCNEMQSFEYANQLVKGHILGQKIDELVFGKETI